MLEKSDTAFKIEKTTTHHKIRSRVLVFGSG